MDVAQLVRLPNKTDKVMGLTPTVLCSILSMTVSPESIFTFPCGIFDRLIDPFYFDF